jgi:hypothetical protein
MKFLSLFTAALIASTALTPFAAFADDDDDDDRKSRWSRHRGDDDDCDDRDDRKRRRKDNGKHKGWYKNGKADSWNAYSRRHDDWHRSRRSSHRDNCSFDNGRWRREDPRYAASYDPYYDGRNDRYDRNDPYWRNDRLSASEEARRRQQTKNEWRNLAIAAGAVGVLGLLKGDETLMFAGLAGALYSAHRYEQDRKSQNRLNRARAHIFSQPYFYRDGQRFDRRTVTRNGQKYYQFVRAR